MITIQFVSDDRWVNRDLKWWDNSVTQRLKMIAQFRGKSSPNSHQAKESQIMYIKAQLKGTNHLCFWNLKIPTTNHVLKLTIKVKMKNFESKK